MRTYHFLGIGGIGMSGLARVLLQKGYRVSGSDVSSNNLTIELKKMGCNIYSSHDPANIPKEAIIVRSSAVKQDNPEFSYAIQNGFKIISRGELLAEIVSLGKNICVAGAHGKTTTSAMIAFFLRHFYKDTSYIVGGIISNFKTNADWISDKIFVAEADESDGSFLKLHPHIAVVTNIDNDHLDYYKNFENIHTSFVDFTNNIPSDGLLVSLHEKRISDTNRIRHKTFSLTCTEATFFANNINENERGTSFDIIYQGKAFPVTISLWGKYNILNFLAAICVVTDFNISLEEIIQVAYEFNGVSRRLEKLINNENFILIDDYAHHPKEIEAVTNAVNNVFNDKKINFVFEPHRFSRTSQLMEQFVMSLKDLRSLAILPIYSAGEVNMYGDIENKFISEVQNSNSNTTILKDYNDLQSYLKDKMKSQEVVVLLGAGPISDQGRIFAKIYG